jgi:hypothetical protein
MPVARYFLFVGGVLLALLFVIDAFSPQRPAVASSAAPSVDKYVVRIKSDQKLPQRVVYDTSMPTIVPPQATVVASAAPPAPAAATSAQARVRDTFAQFVPAEARNPDKQLVKQAEKQPEPQAQAPKKRKIAKVHPITQPQQSMMRFAQQQQPRFGFFGGPTWNSTW